MSEHTDDGHVPYPPPNAWLADFNHGRRIFDTAESIPKRWAMDHVPGITHGSSKWKCFVQNEDGSCRPLWYY